MTFAHSLVPMSCKAIILTIDKMNQRRNLSIQVITTNRSGEGDGRVDFVGNIISQLKLCLINCSHSLISRIDYVG